jgi:hypothetical protein
MLNEGRVNQSADRIANDQQVIPATFGRTGEQLVADARPRFYDMVKRGNVYMAANTAAGALTVVNASATGLILFNPPGSGKNLVLMRLCVALQSLPAGAAGLVLVGGNQAALPATTWTALTTSGSVNGVLPAFLRGTTNGSVAMAASAANAIPTVIQRWIGGGAAATVAASTTWTPQIVDQIDGEIVMGPGSIIALESVTTAITVGASLTWEEVPIG